MAPEWSFQHENMIVPPLSWKDETEALYCSSPSPSLSPTTQLSLVVCSPASHHLLFDFVLAPTSY